MYIRLAINNVPPYFPIPEKSKQMKEITHKLIDKHSNKVINLTLNDKILISETGKDNKLKTTEKEFLSRDEALKYFYKKEWEALKKGFVLNNENAELGQPTLHKFIGGAYTGALALENSPIGIFVYEDKMQNAESVGTINLIDNIGSLLKTIALPKSLAWNMEYSAGRNSLILDLDHYIYEFDIENGTFNNLGQEKSYVDSFISVAKDKIAFATLGKLCILDNQNKIIHASGYEVEVIKGTTPFCGKLSNDGKLLAFHNQVGEIQIIDAKNGNLLSKINGTFEMVFQLEFANDNKLLVVREQYGTWGMRYFDLSTNEEIEMKDLEIPEFTKEVNAFCFNTDQTKLVLLQRVTAYVFDFTNKKLLSSFKIEHLGKKCEIKFVGEKLGVRTDYGCFSLYKV